jgi:hypothetical protein
MLIGPMSKIELPIEEERFFQMDALFGALWAMTGTMLMAFGGLSSQIYSSCNSTNSGGAYPNYWTCGPSSIVEPVMFSLAGLALILVGLVSIVMTSRHRKARIRQRELDTPSPQVASAESQ